MTGLWASFTILADLLNRMTVIIVWFGKPCGWALGTCSVHIPAGYSDIYHGTKPNAKTAGWFKVAPAPNEGRHAGPSFV